MSNTPDRKLSPAEIDAFGAELDALRARTVAKLGAEDAKYIRNIVRTVRYTEVAGRALLMAGIFPPAWILGTLSLGVSKIIENMELGHNVMHAQYDWMNDPELNGQTYEWDTACTADHWRQTHNYEHHTYTNVMGKDHDIGYGVLRLFPEQKWEPRFLANPIMALVLMTLFQHLLALQSLQLEKLLSKEKTFAEVKEQAKPILKKMRKQIAKDYLVFPALAGPFFPIVFAGNVAANLIRNFWSSAIIFCGHFTQDAEVFPIESLENESRGHWYLRQLKGSSNLEGNKLMHIMSGNLSHQIEHHLFPDVPGRRYAEMSVEVREICKRYGQHYNSKPFFRQLGEVAGRILRYSLPNKPTSKKADPAVREREEELVAA
jgi:NADPH-dependent stearoyl-CoA 9-desaturase